MHAAPEAWGEGSVTARFDSDPPLLATLEDDRLDAWAAFLGDGEWTLQRPEDPGIYWVASLEGDPVGLRELKMVDGDLVDTKHAHGEPGWQGYWWSHSLPYPPKEVPN